ncbi:MAG: flagellin [Anaerohalosphaeraceae bacterium]
MGTSDFSTSSASAISGAYAALGTLFQGLSSGQRINSASDDAAGLAVAEQMRGSMVDSIQALRNLSDGTSMIQTADGAASVISDNLIRMKELAAQSSGGILSIQQKEIIQREFDQLAAENARIAETTEFNGIKLFTQGQSITLSIGFGNMLAIQTQAIAVVSADLSNNTLSATEVVDQAINQLAAMRGGFGASMNEMELANQTLEVQVENLMAAESRIMDADMAQETANLTATKILAEAAMATQAQANLSGELVATLIRK